MDMRRLIAYLAIALGAVTLLGRLSGGTGWLWVGVVAVAFLYAYSREGTYGLLAIGSVLSGVAVGILLEGNLAWDGAFLVSLGAGFVAIDLVEPRRGPWPRLVGALLILLGLAVGIAQAGILGSTWFAVLLIAAGIYLVARRDDDGWVHVGPPPGSESAFPHAPQPTPGAAEEPEPALRRHDAPPAAGGDHPNHDARASEDDSERAEDGDRERT